MGRLIGIVSKAKPFLLKGGCSLWIGCMLLAACSPAPQPVRRLHDKAAPDTAVLAQMRFNYHMATTADSLCCAVVQRDSLRYAQDLYGFWYCKTRSVAADTLRPHDAVRLRLRLREFTGRMIADEEDLFTVNDGTLPTAIARSLRMMGYGEQMQVIAPWYAAYGVEGSSIVPPYTNLRITIDAADPNLPSDK